MTDAKVLEKSLFAEGIDIPQKILENAGGVDGKDNENISLASHLVNVTLLGLNCYAYDNLVLSDEGIDDEEISVLTSALVLHDVNKYVHERYGWDRDQNTEEIFEKYLEDDDFGVSTLFDQMDKDIEDYKEDILFLIQRTEINDRSQDTRGLSTKFRHLIDYCRLGDSVSSRITNNGLKSGAEKLRNHYSGLDFHNVHHLKFDGLEQPLLNSNIIGAIKKSISREESCIVLGSTSEEIIYLGQKIEEEKLRRKCKELVPERIKEFYDFKPKTGWNSTKYGILEDLDLPVKEKKEILATEFANDWLLDGGAGIEGFENISEEFMEYLPYLIKNFYNPHSEKENDPEFKDDELKEKYREIKNDRPQKVKLHIIAHLLENWPESKEKCKEIKNLKLEELEEELEPTSNAFEKAVDRFFGSRSSEITEKSEQCFICGRKAKKEYQKGNAFYTTQAFSRRVAPSPSWDNYKKICPECNLEYALLRDECENKIDNFTDNKLKSTEIAYFYFDDFIGAVNLYEETISDPLEGEDQSLDSPSAVRELWRPQFKVMPLYSTSENFRLVKIKEILKKLQKFGMKTIVGQAFQRFEPKNYVFYDENPLRIQKVLKFDKIESYSDLNKPILFFDVLDEISYIDSNSVKNKNKYLQINSDRFTEMADFAVKKDSKQNKMIHSDLLNQYFESYRGNEFMEMQKVAENGVDLFGKQFNSKHKKTKIFRETIDALLAGKSQGLDDQNLRTHVYGQVKTSAEREDYAGKVTGEQVENFVNSVIEYLEDNNLYELKKLSDWENALTNSYYYAYENILYGDQE